ncbi:hypothetical protein ACFQZS_00115 [Mucilaginibacter calamicampi]|uniref:DUF4919 domain-containing protein n=1 Tax=Mucilaginibacter calamicampi TaxID=1302352 RepID=A0ABW2YSB1_9SPHI
MRALIPALLFAVVIATPAIAQKLPNVQQTSVKAPANIKIDGNLNEWNNQLQAFNKTDGLYYTISNDDKNLYLSLIAPNKDACRKALRGGITFSVVKVEKKNVYYDPLKKMIDFVLLKNDDRNELIKVMDKYLDKNNKNSDSLLAVINKKIGVLLKRFEINGDDVPVYNDLNIVAGIRFNKNLDLVYELCVPLSYLDMDKDYAAPFTYTVCLSAHDEVVRRMMWKKPTPGSPFPPPPPMLKPGAIAPPPPPPDPRFTNTEFSAKYTLAK